MLLYRVNQVPDKLYVKFLELIGVRLAPPRAARAPVTFYLSAAQPVDVTIPEGTEVATGRTETSDAIVFTTETDLQIRTPKLRGAFTGHAGPASLVDSVASAWTAHDVNKLGLAGQQMRIFGSSAQGGAAPSPKPGDAV